MAYHMDFSKTCCFHRNIEYFEVQSEIVVKETKRHVNEIKQNVGKIEQIRIKIYIKLILHVVNQNSGMTLDTPDG